MNIHELRGAGLSVLGRDDAREAKLKILRQSQPERRAAPLAGKFGDMREKLVNGIEGKELDAGDFIDALLRDLREGALHLGQVAGVAVAVGAAHAVVTV